MRDVRRRRHLSHALVASLLSVLVTALSIAVTQSLAITSRPFTIAITVSFIAAALVTLAAVYLDAYIRDLRELFQELRVAQKTSQVVSDIVRFVSRQDIVTLHPNGDAEITWIFELVSRPEEPVSELAFPLYYYNSPLAKGDPTIRIESITVNDRVIRAESTFAHLEHRVLVSDEARARHGGDEFVEYGLLRVPVDFSPARPVCRVQVRIRFFDVFRDPVNRIYVDVPYVTDRVRVAVAAPGSITRRATAPEGNTIVAWTAMQALDVIESRAQSRACQQDGDTVVWDSTALKLGYQYVLHISREPTTEGGSGTGSQPPSGDAS